MSEPDRGHHDIGGDPAGPVPRTEHVLAPWEKEVDAILNVLRGKGLMSADKLRLGIEQLPPGDYRRLSYYERWLASVAWTMFIAGEPMKAATNRFAGLRYRICGRSTCWSTPRFRTATRSPIVIASI